MPSTYLFLNAADRSVSGTSGANWLNLPTLFQSTRECYLTVLNCYIVFNGPPTLHEAIVLKMNVPTTNYFSSDNQAPCVAFLSTIDYNVYTTVQDNEIRLLTTDALKNIEFVFEDEGGEPIVLTVSDSISVMLRLDYVDQKEQVMGQLQTVPQRL
jgi:hypothetical protein